MRRTIRPLTEAPLQVKAPDLEAPLVSDISVQRLIDDSLLALYREVKNIVFMSSKGKLDANTARDLRDHLKLLFELKAREAESLRSLSDEQIEELSKKEQANE